jgi:putative YphP/YqiW family bacilliredoxin
MYPAELVQPMKDDLTNVGFAQLTDALEVDNMISNTQGTLLMVVNSVCGCAAGNMRPGVRFRSSGSSTQIFLALPSILSFNCTF